MRRPPIVLPIFFLLAATLASCKEPAPKPTHDEASVSVSADAEPAKLVPPPAERPDGRAPVQDGATTTFEALTPDAGTTT
ncbi:MAG TPA: hypothetical protein VNO21_02785, partial [Polyangiaceae bacterium]|nr:hypothetical protein [Polyangiaceae bacterium]